MAQPALVPRTRDYQHSDMLQEEILAWSANVIEQPHPVFGGLPICPFARAARIRQTIRFHVTPFELNDPLDSAGPVMALIREFAVTERWETLFVIHPDRNAFDSKALEQFVTRLGRHLRTIGHMADLRVFEAHPRSNFCIGGVFTRRSPYPSFQVLSHGKLKEGSDTLLETRYYDRFTPEMLRAVGMPR